jgi:hypothetical protein
MSLERAHETACERDMDRACRIALKLSPKMNQPKANFNQEAALAWFLKYTCIPFVHSTDSQAAERPFHADNAICRQCDKTEVILGASRAISGDGAVLSGDSADLLGDTARPHDCLRRFVPRS